ncbi:MAG: archaellin/type IV pilin N-terminal domain-containing protein [Candidatus Aenigmatarchaeota archaeon]
MKGISEIIATILMLMITLGISGTAYIFISGAFTQQTQGLEVVDAYCQDGTPDVVNLIMRNLGTVAMTTSSFVVIQTNPADDDGVPPAGPATPNKIWVGGITSIAPGTTATLQDACEGNNPRSCIYRISPPAGRSIVASVSCS